MEKEMDQQGKLAFDERFEDLQGVEVWDAS